MPTSQINVNFNSSSKKRCPPLNIIKVQSKGTPGKRQQVFYKYFTKDKCGSVGWPPYNPSSTFGSAFQHPAGIHLNIQWDVLRRKKLLSQITCHSWRPVFQAFNVNKWKKKICLPRRAFGKIVFYTRPDFDQIYLKKTRFRRLELYGVRAGPRA